MAYMILVANRAMIPYRLVFDTWMLKNTAHGSSMKPASVKIFTAAIASWSASFHELVRRIESSGVVCSLDQCSFHSGPTDEAMSTETTEQILMISPILPSRRKDPDILTGYTSQPVNFVLGRPVIVLRMP